MPASRSPRRPSRMSGVIPSACSTSVCSSVGAVAPRKIWNFVSCSGIGGSLRAGSRRLVVSPLSTARRGRASRRARPKHRTSPVAYAEGTSWLWTARRWGMIGRERAVDVLHGAVARVAAGGSVCLLVAGEPGLGKTTTLAVLADLAADAGLTVGTGRCALEGAAPLWPWTTALAALHAHAPDGPGAPRAPAAPAAPPGPSGPDPEGPEPSAWVAGGAARVAGFGGFAGALGARAPAGPPPP